MNRLIALLALLVVLALVACSTPTAAPQAPAQATRGGTLVHGTYADAKVLNPHLTTDIPSSEIFSRVYEALLDTDPTTGAPIPWLAEKWDISQDGLTYTFYLRKDVKWHDGKPFTANDVKYTVEAILDPKTDSPRKSLFDQVKGAKDRQDKTKNVTETVGVKVVDDYTIKFELTEPYCPFLVSTMTALRVLPKHLYEGTDVNTNEYNKKTGRYGRVEIQRVAKGRSRYARRQQRVVETARRSNAGYVHLQDCERRDGDYGATQERRDGHGRDLAAGHSRSRKNTLATTLQDFRLELRIYGL